MLLSQNTFTIKRLLKEPLTIELSPETLAIAADSSGVGNLSNAEFAVRVLKDGKELYPVVDESLEGVNLLPNSGHFLMTSDAGDISLSLRSDEADLYYRATPYSGKTVACYGFYNLLSSGQTYIQSLFVRQNSGSDVDVALCRWDGTAQLGNKITTVKSGVWTYISTESFMPNLVLSGSVVFIAKTADIAFDFKKAKLEKGIVPTEWTPKPSELLQLSTITTNKCTAVVIDNTVKITTLTPGYDAGWVDVEMAYGSLSTKKRFTWALAKGGISISNVDVEYAVNTSTTVAPTTGWATTAPAISGTQQLWTRTKTSYSTGSPTYSTPANITPQIGKGVVSIIEEYYLSTSKTTQTGGSWVTSPPAWSSGKYLWTRSKITYSNPTSTAYTTPVVSSEWEAVNELEIGGRNLWLKSSVADSFPYWTASGGTKSIDDTFLYEGGKTIKLVQTTAGTGMYNNYARQGLPANTEFVYSFMVYSSVPLPVNGNSLAHMQVMGTASAELHRETNLEYPQSVLANTWTKVVVRFSTPAPLVAGETFAFRAYLYFLPVGTYYFTGFKLEKGNKASDWTPAPEDVDAKIEDIQVGGENIADRTEIAIVAGAEISKFDFIKGNLSSTPISGSYLRNNQAHVLTISESIKTAGTATHYSVVLYDFTQLINTYQQEFTFSTAKRVIKFTTPATGNWSLLIYAGIAGATAGNSVEYKGIMLQEGNKETAYQSAVKYLTQAMQGSTEISGGLVATNIMLLKNALNEITGGMSGIDDDNIGFWTGGTYADALAGLAKIILRKDGSGQLAGGSLSWDLLGQLLFGKVGDSETIKISTGAIPDLAEINNREEYSLPVLNENVVKNLNNPADAGINVNTSYSQEFTLENDGYLTIDAAVHYSAGSDIIGFGIDGMVWLEKFNGTSWVVIEDGTVDGLFIYLNLYQYSVTKGRFRVRWDVVCDYTDVQGSSATISLNKFCGIDYKLNVKKLVIGIDGIALFDSMSDKYLRLSLKDNVAQLRMKLDTDMPGVLLAGDGNAGGGGIIRFGAKRHTSETVEPLGTGYYKVWHSIGHNLYTVQLTMKTAGMNGVWEAPNNDYFIVRTYSGTNPANANFSFVVLGDN